MLIQCLEELEVLDRGLKAKDFSDLELCSNRLSSGMMEVVEGCCSESQFGVLDIVEEGICLVPDSEFEEFSCCSRSASLWPRLLELSGTRETVNSMEEKCLSCREVPAHSIEDV